VIAARKSPVAVGANENSSAHCAPGTSSNGGAEQSPPTAVNGDDAAEIEETVTGLPVRFASFTVCAVELPPTGIDPKSVLSGIVRTRGETPWPLRSSVAGGAPTDGTFNVASKRLA